MGPVQNNQTSSMERKKSSAYGQAANGAGVADAPGQSGSSKQISPPPRLRSQSAG